MRRAYLKLKTKIVKIDQNNIEKDKLIYAANIIRNGGLVAFPTETVYGLGANALNSESVNSIFKAKGRPSDNPLIVHIADSKSIDHLVLKVLPGVQKLINRFWPGPLTLVFRKSPIIPDEITAGLDTVAIRMPSHPIALALIKESGLPIAAPSANSSGRPSPTLASHVMEDLSGKVDLIIDGGATDVGLESTVLDTTSIPPSILRPGAITIEQLREELEEVELDPALLSRDYINVTPKSPGVKYKHYSPTADLIVVEGEPNNVVSKINELVIDYTNKGIKVGILATEQTKDFYNRLIDNKPVVISMGDRSHPDMIASNLFSCFREMDHQNIQVILAEAVNKTGIGLAVMNRMNKAAGYNIIKA
jgi:L-threonylcarbamoyladenylate synthase